MAHCYPQMPQRRAMPAQKLNQPREIEFETLSVPWLCHRTLRVRRSLTASGTEWLNALVGLSVSNRFSWRRNLRALLFCQHIETRT